jgi:hypothetical protein
MSPTYVKSLKTPKPRFGFGTSVNFDPLEQKTASLARLDIGAPICELRDTKRAALGRRRYSSMTISWNLASARVRASLTA